MKRELIILIAAAFMGVAAVVFYKIRIASVEQEIKSQIEDRIEVCMIKEGIPVRGMIDKKNVTKEEVPRLFIHPKAVKWTDRKRLYGQRVINPLQQGQPILWSDLEEQSNRSVDGSILPGRAVVTIPIDMVGGVGGLVSPGSRVDLYGIFKTVPQSKPDAAELIPGQSNVPTDLEELNRQMAEAAKNMLSKGLDAGKDFYVVPFAANLGVFAVGSQTQIGGDTAAAAAEERGGYSTISFDVPAQMQVLLIMAMRKVRTEGGQLICVLRSNRAGSDTGIEPGKTYSSQDFIKLISKANAEMDKSR
ncbi:MAG: Flp pilus assembly protein CpaB [Planctomycetes bacterium]|nr:Flp pilus assembly protein CpaB [Planctomycetota bacterium]